MFCRSHASLKSFYDCQTRNLLFNFLSNLKLIVSHTNSHHQFSGLYDLQQAFIDRQFIRLF